jgi:hypothetical protein
MAEAKLFRGLQAAKGLDSKEVMARTKAYLLVLGRAIDGAVSAEGGGSSGDLRGDLWHFVSKCAPFSKPLHCVLRRQVARACWCLAAPLTAPWPPRAPGSSVDLRGDLWRLVYKCAPSLQRLSGLHCLWISCACWCLAAPLIALWPPKLEAGSEDLRCNLWHFVSKCAFLAAVGSALL